MRFLTSRAASSIDYFSIGAKHLHDSKSISVIHVLVVDLFYHIPARIESVETFCVYCDRNVCMSPYAISVPI
jgi:hypothetical protein